MDNKIKENLVKLIKNTKNPQTGEFFKIDDEVNIIVREKHVTITIQIDHQKLDLFKEVNSYLKEQVDSNKDILSSNIILTADKKSTQNNQFNNKYKLKPKNIIAIASGKGGVGKSTVSVNLSIALSKIGKSVALLDADIYGPSIPRMMGINNRPITNENKKFIPLENHGIKCRSIGFLITPDTPAIWRGPMIMKALEQLFLNVEWGETEYMIIDLPPGTGDTQLTIAQKVDVKGAIIISTPQDIALIDAIKGVNMFKKVNIPVIGLIENMSYFICDKCNQRHEIFSHGGAKQESEKLKTNFLGEIPINKDLRICSDQGKPILIEKPESEISKIYLEIANKLTII